MIAELAHLSLIIAFMYAILLALLPAWGVKQGQAAWMQLYRPLASGLMVFVGVSFALLVACFVQDDFTVKYVANNSHTDLPLVYKVSATWGAHEGSLLLWVLILSVWVWLASRRADALPEVFRARLFSSMGWIAIGMIAFVLFTSNPFERLLDAPLQGRSLNPLLQDIGLAIHPPILYIGYVGFVVPFAVAIASLQSAEFAPRVARWAKVWALWSWAFLTLGIALGSWWAYYELGWGGWWFWDPVENASLLPWLVGTALIHSLAVSEKRNQFQAWTLLLALLAFSLSLLGTFLVRSGVLTSVHAFTSDPSRGVFILVFLAMVVGYSLSLYAKAAPQVTRPARFKPLSREFALLLNNVILMVMMATVLLGTLYPLLLDALGMGKLSVGAPYFNKVMMPLTLLLTILMGAGLWLSWQQDLRQRLQATLLPVLIMAALAAALLPWLLLPEVSGVLMLGLFMAAWVGISALWWLWRQRTPWRLSSFAPFLAHLGFAVTLTGIVLTSLLSVEKDLRLALNEAYQVQAYRFVFKGVTQGAKANYHYIRGWVAVFDGDEKLADLYPEKRTYTKQGMPMTEAGIDAGLTRDLFVALGEPLADGAWSLRIQYKPMIRWIWLGAIMMAIAAVLAAFQRRYRQQRAKDES